MLQIISNLNHDPIDVSTMLGRFTIYNANTTGSCQAIQNLILVIHPEVPRGNAGDDHTLKPQCSVLASQRLSEFWAEQSTTQEGGSNMICIE
jgi:hypothetical protein